MILEDALIDIAQRFNFNAEELTGYAQKAPPIGGHEPGNAKARWDVGSIWEVDGVILYALVRALQPRHCLEFGAFKGCSSRYIIAALQDNGAGYLTSIDNGVAGGMGPQFTEQEQEFACFIRQDLFDYEMPDTDIDFVFEDAMHTSKQVEYIWRMFAEKGQPGAMIVSHDARHYMAGTVVCEAIERVTDQFHTYLVEPGLCGLAVWRKP